MRLKTALTLTLIAAIYALVFTAAPFTVAVAVADDAEDAPKPPSKSQIQKKIVAYIEAAPDKRGEFAEFFDTVPALKKKEAAKWRGVIKAALARKLFTDAQKTNGDNFKAFAKGGTFRVEVAGTRMKYHFKLGGKKGRAGYPLYINLHDGSPDPGFTDNMWEWAKSQYTVNGCLIAPRAPKEALLPWSVGEMWGLLDLVISESLLLRNVDPDRVYLIGYSLGGWGVFHIAPLMADRFAAAAAAAGGAIPGASLDNLRNTPILIQIGEFDTEYNRLESSRAYAKKLDGLEDGDAGGYVHKYIEHYDYGHDIDDKNAPKWLSKYTREAYPKRVVWQPAGAAGHTPMFYYLGLEKQKGGASIAVSRKGNTFTVEKAAGVSELTIYLDDAFVDLSKPIVVKMGEKELFNGTVERRLLPLLESFTARCDERWSFSAKVVVKPNEK